MQNVIVNVNGQILSPDAAESAQIPVFDRSYLYGDSLYEVARSYGGTLFGVPEHLERLDKSAKLCRMVLGQPLSLYAAEMKKTVETFQALFRSGSAPEVYCRLIISRGMGSIGFGLNCLKTATQYVIIVQPVDEPTAEQVRKGLHLQVSARLRNDPRALDPAMKSGNYLNSLLAYLESTAEGFDDALLCNADGHITEGTTFNIGYIRREIIATSPLDIGILDGITRRALLGQAELLKIPVRETRFPKERLYEADEVFITSTIKEILPVTRIDGRKIGSGNPGKLTMKLREGFRDYLREHFQ